MAPTTQELAGEQDNSTHVGSGGLTGNIEPGGAGGDAAGAVEPGAAGESLGKGGGAGVAGVSVAGAGVAGAGVAGAGVAGAGGNGPNHGISTAEATIVPDPSWTCGLPSGIVPPTRGALLFRVTIELGATHYVGATEYGDRRVLQVKGGAVTGRVNGTVLSGGLELELTLANGSVELEELLVLRANDGTLIHLRTCGVAPAGDQAMRVVPDFEVSNTNALAWLNGGKYGGTRVLDPARGTVELSVYEVSNVVAAAPWSRLEDPPGVLNQAWECATTSQLRGPVAFRVTLDIGPLLLVGTSKRGTRNVVRLEGGTTRGRVTGAVLPGLDPQLLGYPIRSDARYVLSTNDGERILVRNCGPFDALVPRFEARTAGPYAFLNSNAFASSRPDVEREGTVITFYEGR
jgi:hypothetical protein